MFTIIPEPGAGASLSSPGFTGPEKKPWRKIIIVNNPKILLLINRFGSIRAKNL